MTFGTEIGGRSEGVRVLWNGRVWIIPFFDPISLHYRIELGGWAAPVFIQANSALDLWGVTRDGLQDAMIIGWAEPTKFDEIYMDPDSTNWHDEFPEELGAIVIGKLLEGPQFVRPTLVTPNGGESWPAGATRRISWEYDGLQSGASVALYARSVMLPPDMWGEWRDISSEIESSGETYADWRVSGPDGFYQIKVETTHPYAGVEEDISYGLLLISTQYVVAPVGGQFHASGKDLAVEWLWREALSVDIAFSSNGGQTFPYNFPGLPNGRCNPANPSSNGCYTIASVAGASSQCVVRVTSHYPDGGSGAQLSAGFTLWGIVATSVQPTVTTSCDNKISITVPWTTTAPTDGPDQLDLYRPSAVPCTGVPSHVRTAATPLPGGTSHLLNYQGPCEIGTWYCVVKSTKAGSETKSTCYAITVNGCASCSQCPPPGCELE